MATPESAASVLAGESVDEIPGDIQNALDDMSVPKKCVRRSQSSFFVRCHIVCMSATSGPSPSVSGTKRKW